ncbi:tRNA (adenosine(37)-N6)-threonylcarbamoyltransferase complex dimerization subunit type 1 TsaB [Ornithinicoccus hortensis]|uniref:tRNA threonylcarbamoyl adenosine modification protein YeaZ n=1 Tax=Ornithinicoccus hortensis TaxID=82346 RepID=A0A542YQ19_9MICO|nr:tRNA (adenosine(37)-N6)-threonylcarbamoyltransferase complex dimerization subunit type 1 TsaB [Ornithinicoccus hortensis]TQL50200.1 tRNA threonylcarbamoyl adenosine modification protein YeaZ [Ornithinicoccus hortensis]
MLLALDTATASVGVAVHHDGRLLAEVATQDDRRHGELLAPTLSAALDRAGVRTGDLDAVVCGVGPGPFTGLRVGVVTALVLAHAADVPVYGVCSLDAIAHDGVGSGLLDDEFLVATDARRKEVYWARYAVSDGLALRVAGPEVARAADLPAPLRALPCLGRGPLLYPDSLTAPGGTGAGAPEGTVDVRAGALAAVAAGALADGDPHGVLLDPEPLYLRRPDAAVPGPVKQVLAPGPSPRGSR